MKRTKRHMEVGHVRSMEDEIYLHQPLFIWSAFWTICLLRTITVKFKLPIHYNIFTVVVGVLGAVFVDVLDFRSHYELLYTYYLRLLMFFLPGAVFKIAFQLDHYIFLKTLSQIFVISFPVSILTGLSTGFVTKMVMKDEWTWTHAIMFGMNCAQIYAPYTEQYLQRFAVQMKHTSCLLDAEAIMSNINCYIAYVTIMCYSTGVFSDWYHYAMALARMVGSGLLFGFLFGMFGQLLIKRMYNDHLGVVIATFAIPYFSFTIAEIYFYGCGTITVMVVGLMMGSERSTLTIKSSSVISSFWITTETLLTIFIILVSAFQIMLNFMEDMSDYFDWVFVLVVYVLYSVFRFVWFLLFAPALSRLGYGMDVKSMLLCVFGGLKHPLCVLYSGIYIERVLLEDYSDVTIGDGFETLVFGLYFFSYLVNGSCIPALLRVLGMAQVSMAKQVNMNNCMKHIFTKRDHAIAILKMDRYGNDSNWALIAEATSMRHPDKVDAHTDDTDEGLFMGYRFTYCPDCQKDVAEEPTKKELREMGREAKMRVLKAIKMSYARQYENGMVSKGAFRILNQAVELAMDTEAAMICIDGLHRRFNRESWFKKFIRQRVRKLTETGAVEFKAPRQYWTRLCYHLVRSALFNHFINMVNILNLVVLGINLFMALQQIIFYINEGTFTDNHFYIAAQPILDVCEISFFFIFVFEFIFRVLAYSRNGIGRGLVTYFQSIWHVVDFTVILIYTWEITVLMLEKFKIIDPESMAAWRLHIIIDFTKMVRILKIFEIFMVYYPMMVRRLDRAVDANMAFTYELGKAYVSGVDEVQQMLPQIIDHDGIREELRQTLDLDRMNIIKLLGLVQKERPWIAITVKTKQAIRTVNNSIKESVMGLKTSGWTDYFEHEKLMASVSEMYKRVNSIKSVQPSAPEVIFKEVAWIAGDEVVFDFLFENVALKKYEPGEVVFGEGTVADGIYVVVTGLFLLTYTPDPSVLTSLTEYGQLPIVDYVLPADFGESGSDYIVSGNCMGELSTLTGRPYNCCITADAHSQVYVLSNNVIKRAMELSKDPVNGLECRIWKAISVRLAVSILMGVSTYQSLSQDQIKYTLERAFMPDLSNFKIFSVNDMIMDIILIEGLAADYNSREIFVAPIYIPRTVQKLILPRSSQMQLAGTLDIKLLIIPEKDVDEVDVMLLTEETCEMVAQDSSLKCLQHTIQKRTPSQRRRKRNKGMMEVESSNIRKRRYGSRSRMSPDDESSYTLNTMSMASVAIDASSEEEVKSTKMTGKEDK